jgi:hypothetical protein
MRISVIAALVVVAACDSGGNGKGAPFSLLHHAGGDTASSDSDTSGDKSSAVATTTGSRATGAPAGSATTPTTATPTTAPGTGTAVNDPWGSAPAQTNTDLGASTGGRLAKVDPAPKTAPQPNDKVDPTTIAQPSAPNVDVHGFNTKTGGTDDPPPGFSVTYNPSSNPTHEQYRQSMMENRVFDQIAEGLNKTVRLPRNITIETVDCNTVNAFYDPSTNRIIVCYELVDYFVGIFKPHAKNDAELGSSVMGATIFTFYHETGHGLIHQLDLAAVGREEDSVDQLATLILIGEGEKGVQMALSGAYWFQLQTKQGDKTPFWNEHSFDGQRFYNILCLIYGSNPDKYGDFVDSGNLPMERAQRCPEEYRKIQHAWETLLGPYLTNGAAMNVDYKPSVPVVEAPKTTKTDPWGDGESGNSTPTTQPDPNWGKEQSKESAPAVTCEAVAAKASALIELDSMSRAKTTRDKEEVERRLVSALPAVREKLIAQCAKENWSPKSRQCVLDAPDLATATKCN